ncbi:hypothetical protein ACJRO7_032744 [Eucalyptus globulus]|uniref:LRAT domain-containing protein n=1 Tax=Eucalyptus globulus TaxID=34317 RepID=A0ABD3JLU7_EUCGL
MHIIKRVLTTSVQLMVEKARPEDMKPGDHIYRYGLYGLYSHHGIYVGDDYVIHFTRTESKTTVLPSLSKQEILPPCPKCEYQKNIKRGVVKTCLDCFRWDGIKLRSLHFYEHRWPLLGYKLTRQGTNTTLLYTRLPNQVVDTACKLHASNGFGNYSLINNNCEHFATFCRTGIRASKQTAFLSDCERKIKEAKEWIMKSLKRN